jgi:hypothetical protein
MKKTLIMAVVFTALAALVFQVMSCTNANNPSGPAATVTPDAGGFYGATASGMTFKWKITGSNIDCKLTGPTNGWIAVMLNSSGVMNGANTVIGYVTSPSTVTISHETGNSSHGHDPNITPDLAAVTGIEASESGGTTEIDWTMPLTPSNGYVPVQGATMYAILAYGSSDSLSSMHSAYGKVQIKLQ